MDSKQFYQSYLSPEKSPSVIDFSPKLCAIDEESVLLDNSRNEGSIKMKFKSRSTPVRQHNISICSGMSDEEFLSCHYGEDTSLYQSAVVTSTSQNCIDEFCFLIDKTVNVGVQCELEPYPLRRLSKFQSLSFQINTLVAKVISWPPRISLFLKKCVSAIQGWYQSLNEKTCGCVKSITEIESRLNLLEAEIKSYRELEVEYLKMKNVLADIALEKQKAVATTPSLFPPKPPVLSAAPAPPPPPPPPPPPLPPITSLEQNKLIIQKRSEKSHQTPAANPRLSITDQDLASVKLKKVCRPEKDVAKSSGAVVTLEQLRSVKLRSRRRQLQPPQSPTRTPLSRDRLRKIRSPSHRFERRPRIDRIPLSKILSLEDSP